MQLLIEIVRSSQAADPFAFQSGSQEYVLRTPLGGAETATLVWDDSLLHELAELRRPAPDPTLIQRLGERLRRFLATPSFAKQERELLAAVASQEPVFLTFRLAAAELLALPWELLALSGSGQKLGALPGVLLRYAWPQTQTVPPRPESLRREGGRILLAWSAAAGAVPAVEQEAAIQRACQLGQLPFDPERDVLPHLSAARLSQRLREQQDSEPVTILHLLCHGSRRENTFGLAWDSDDGGMEVVDAGQLRQLLAPHARELRLVVLSACDSGNSGPLGNHLGSVAQALHRVGIAAVVASRFPLSVAGSLVLTEELYQELLGRPSSLELAFGRARQRLLQETASLDWAALQLYARPEDGDNSRPVLFRPYRGLSPFLPNQRRFFFGREQERAAARAAMLTLAQASKPRFLLVTGASGTGKSSVVLGGLLPDFVDQHPTVAHPDSLSRTASELLGLLRDQSDRPQTPKLQAAVQTLLQELGTLVQLGGDGCWEWLVLRPGPQPEQALQQALARRQHPSQPLLLIVDQLEELFTHCEDVQARSAFVQALWTQSKTDSGIHCVVTLRVDFLGRCGELVLDEEGLRLDRIAYSEEHRVFVAQPAPEQLAVAITGPAQLVGLDVAESLVQRMVSEVAGEPGALPLLSYVLDLLWQHRDGPQLSERVYAELGGVAGALGRSADQVYFALQPPDQRLARQMLVRLVGFSAEVGGETRRRVPLRELREEIHDPQARLDAVLAAFVESRLLVHGEESGLPVIEFAHEALIRRWERLQGFLKEDRQRLLELRELQKWATQFAAFGSLLRGAQLGYAQRLLEKYPDELGQQVTGMIRRSLQATRRRWLGLGMAICGIVASLTALTVAQRRSEQRAIAERQLAVAKERTARARLLAMHAEQATDAEIDTALLYAVRAMQLHPEHSTRSALASALVRSQPIQRFVRLPPSRVHSVAFTPDSQTVVAATGDAGLWMHDVERGTRTAQRLAPTGSCHTCTPPELYAVAVSPDGQTVAATGQGGQIFLWPTSRFADAAAPPAILTTGARTLYSLDYSPDGTQLAAGAGDGQIFRVDLRPQKAQPAPVASDAAQIVASVAFEPGHGRRLAAVGNGGNLMVFDSASGAPVLGPLAGGHGYLSSVAWSPSARLLAAASEDHTVLLWDTERGQSLTWAPGTTRSAGALSGVTFSPEGRWLASCGLDRAIRLWDVEGLRALGVPIIAPGSAIYSCALSPSGRVLATGSDGLLLLWEITSHPVLHRLRQPVPVSALAVAKSGRFGVVGGPDGTLRPWPLSQSQPGPAQVAHSRAINAVAYSVDGSLLASGSSDGSVGVFAAQSFERQRTFTEPGHGAVMAVAFGPRGDTVAAGFADGTLVLFPLVVGPRPSPIVTRQQSIAALAFSPDGRILWSGGLDGTIRSYSPLTGHPLCPDGSLVHKDSIASLTVSPSERLLASGGRDHAVILSTWNEVTGCLTVRGEPLRKHTALVATLSFSSDGRMLASGGDDAAIVLWDVGEQKPIGPPLRGHQRAITGLAFGSDGQLISGDSETVWRWNVAESHWLDQACARAGHNLSLSDWQRGLGDAPYCRVCAAYPVGDKAPASAPLCSSLRGS